MFGDPTKCLNKTSDIINDERFNGESSRRGSNTRTRKSKYSLQTKVLYYEY